MESAFALLENGERAENEKRETMTGLALGILSPYIWQDLLHAFSDAYPQISVDRHSLEGNEYIRSLFQGKIDLYIGAITQREMTGLEYRILYEDDMVLLVNKKNSFPRKRRSIFRDCGDVNFINLGDETSLQQFLTELYREAGLSPRVITSENLYARMMKAEKSRRFPDDKDLEARRLESDQVVPVDITFPKRKRILV